MQLRSSMNENDWYDLYIVGIFFISISGIIFG